MQYLIEKIVQSASEAHTILMELKKKYNLTILEHEEGGFRIKGEDIKGSCRPKSRSEPTQNLTFKLQSKSLEVTRQIETMFKIPVDTSLLILSLFEFAQLINDGKTPQEIARMARWNNHRVNRYVREIVKASSRKNPSKEIIEAAKRIKNSEILAK